MAIDPFMLVWNEDRTVLRIESTRVKTGSQPLVYGAFRPYDLVFVAGYGTNVGLVLKKQDLTGVEVFRLPPEIELDVLLRQFEEFYTFIPAGGVSLPEVKNHTMLYYAYRQNKVRSLGNTVRQAKRDREMRKGKNMKDDEKHEAYATSAALGSSGPSNKKTMFEQLTTIGDEVGQGAAQAGVNQIGELMVDAAAVASNRNPLVEAALTDPLGREFVKLSMALALFLSAENAPGLIPKAPLIAKAARYQIRHSSSFFTAEVLQKMLPLLSKLAEMAERIPDETPRQITSGSSAGNDAVANTTTPARV